MDILRAGTIPNRILTDSVYQTNSVPVVTPALYSLVFAHTYPSIFVPLYSLSLSYAQSLMLYCCHVGLTMEQTEMRKVDVGVALVFLSGITAVIDAQPTWNRACSNSESQCFQPDVCSYRLWFPRNKNAECPALGELVNQQERLETLEQRLAEMTIQIAELRRQPETVGRNMTKACLSGWHSFNDRCYLVNSDANSWHEAYELCYNAGGRLAIVDGEDVNTFLKALIENRGCWIGLHDMRLEDQWQWINGRSAIYSNWASGEPNNAFNNEHCAHIMGSRDGLWNDMRCTHPIGCELCEYNTGCGIGWHNFGHKCYNVSSEYFTWNEAYTACEQLGRQLVRVNSEDVNAFLVVSRTSCWILGTMY
ncbi:uncharacterized protein [Ptychodera flava]|uniref:uncharacterized protein isoform X2 n=1 Tax=Ptychodera flava TaxID=63121 RepID=UPI003969FF53